MVDFADVKKQFPIEKVVELLGIEVTKQKNGQLRGPCPIHQGSDQRGFVVTPSKNLFFCFGGCGGGDQLALIAKMRECSPKEAAEWLVGGTVTRTEAEPKPEQFQELGYLEAEHEAVEAIGLDAEVAKAVGLGFAPRGTMKGTVAIPIRLKDGTLIGYIGVTDIATIPSRWHLPSQKVVKLHSKKVS